MKGRLFHMKPIALWLAVLFLLAKAHAGDGDLSYEPARFFNTKILPILETHCYECHSQEQGVEGGLALDSRSGWMNGGEHGPAVKPRDLRSSPLIHAVRHADSDSAMPPKKKLADLDIALLETWVLLGAPDPRGDQPQSKQAGK